MGEFPLFCSHIPGILLHSLCLGPEKKNFKIVPGGENHDSTLNVHSWEMKFKVVRLREKEWKVWFLSVQPLVFPQIPFFSHQGRIFSAFFERNPEFLTVPELQELCLFTRRSPVWIYPRGELRISWEFLWNEESLSSRIDNPSPPAPRRNPELLRRGSRCRNFPWIFHLGLRDPLARSCPRADLERSHTRFIPVSLCLLPAPRGKTGQEKGLEAAGGWDGEEGGKTRPKKRPHPSKYSGGKCKNLKKKRKRK